MPFETFVHGGIQSLEHVEEMWQDPLGRMRDGHRPLVDVVREIRDSGVFVAPTLMAYANLAFTANQGQAFIDTVPRERINPVIGFFGDRALSGPLATRKPEAWSKKLAGLEQVTKALHDAGVPLVLGTDTGPALTVPGATTLDEIDRMHRAGLDPYSVLFAATHRPGAMLGLKVGQVREGFGADLLLVEGDPSVDLKALRRRVAVIRAGRLYDREALVRLEGRGEQHDSVYRTVGHLLRHSLFE